MILISIRLIFTNVIVSCFRIEPYSKMQHLKSLRTLAAIVAQNIAKFGDKQTVCEKRANSEWFRQV